MFRRLVLVCACAALALADTLDPQDAPYNSHGVQTSYGPPVSPAHAASAAAPAAAGAPLEYENTGYGVQNSYDGYAGRPEAGAGAGGWLGGAAAGPAGAVIGYKLVALGVVVKLLGWVVVHAWAILLGAIATFAFCKVTTLCDLTHHAAISHAHLESVRAFMTPERLASASDFLHQAIDKYSKRSEDSAARSSARATEGHNNKSLLTEKH